MRSTGVLSRPAQTIWHPTIFVAVAHASAMDMEANLDRQDAGVTANVAWYAVNRCVKQAGTDNLAPHDLRRSCARLCYGYGGELEQIQFLLGHASVQTTERCIGCRQKLKEAVNDRFGISVASDAA